MSSVSLLKKILAELKAGGGTVTVEQSDPTKLKVTVTQDSIARTVTGSITANAGTNLNTSALAISNAETDDNGIPKDEVRETPNVLLYAFDPFTNEWGRVQFDIATGTKILVHASGTFWQAIQPVSGTVTVNDIAAIKTAVQKIDNQEDDILYAHIQKAAVDGDIIAAPGAGHFLRIHHIYVGNEGANFTVFEIEEGTTPRWRFPLAAEGGLAAQNFKRPWDLAANTALHYDHKTGANPVINITIGYEDMVT